MPSYNRNVHRYFSRHPLKVVENFLSVSELKVIGVQVGQKRIEETFNEKVSVDVGECRFQTRFSHNKKAAMFVEYLPENHLISLGIIV